MMKQASMEKPEYGNWVSTRFVYVPAVLGLVFLGFAFLFPFFALLAALFLFISLYFLYARHLFSPSGGNLQYRVRELILSNLEWDGAGQLLDIGCGSGALIIMLAKKFPRARCIGVDNWGGQWEYSKSVAEKNAELEGVPQVEFQKAGAAQLPFEDGSMDVVVSNLVFHEVSGVKDKKELVREALRVVRKGGKFVLQDLFMWKQIYGEPDELVETIRSWGIREVKLVNTSRLDFVPTVLKIPFMMGTIGLLVGEK